MDDQLDSKTLIGSYICAEQPGQFRWQSGSLTQAVQEGFWLVLEDIDKAPSELHSTLLPLLEGSNTANNCVSIFFAFLPPYQVQNWSPFMEKVASMSFGGKQ